MRVRRSAAGEAFEYLFVVTYGRSGSTLLQGILNSIPGYFIRGENGASVHKLWLFHANMLHWRDRMATGEEQPQTSPWWGIDGYPEDVALRGVRDLVVDTIIRPPSTARVVGFKEIRWNHKDLPEYLGFLRAAFPGSRFIFNTRNHEDVAQSSWWKKNPEALTMIAEMEQNILDALASVGEAFYSIHYDDYVNDPVALTELFAWLGEPFDEERTREAMKLRYAYEPPSLK